MRNKRSSKFEIDFKNQECIKITEYTEGERVKKIKVGNISTNFDRIIGMKGIVTEDITKDNIGEVKVDGKCWSAYSDTNIKKGEPVKVLSINSVKIKVENTYINLPEIF